MGSAFPATTFIASGGTGAYTFQQIGALPTGMQFLTDTLSGTPTQTGAFPITVVATDAAGCVGSQDYVVTVTCVGVTITVDPPTVPSVAAGSPFGPVTFTASGGHRPVHVREGGSSPHRDALRARHALRIAHPAGHVPVHDHRDGCERLLGLDDLLARRHVSHDHGHEPRDDDGHREHVLHPVLRRRRAATGRRRSRRQARCRPASRCLRPASSPGTPTQSGTFPITVKATDANGCTGTGPTYTLVIACQTITVNNPVVNSGADGAPFLQTFTQTGAVGGATFSLGSGSLPGGWSLTPAGVLANAAPTPVSFSITVKVTDGNGCTGTGATYTVSILPSAAADTYAPAIVGNMSIDTATGTTFSVLSNDSAGHDSGALRRRPRRTARSS